MNVVRDPVERVISWYYYVRAPWYYVERKQAFPDLPLPDVTWLKKVSRVASSTRPIKPQFGREAAITRARK